MTNFKVYEGQGSVYSILTDNPNVKIGDTVEYLTNNQAGEKKYEVVAGNTNGKDLKEIEEDYLKDFGGKKRKRKSRKRKSRKRKSHKKKQTKRRKYRR